MIQIIAVQKLKNMVKTNSKYLRNEYSASIVESFILDIIDLSENIDDEAAIDFLNEILNENLESNNVKFLTKFIEIVENYTLNQNINEVIEIWRNKI